MLKHRNYIFKGLETESWECNKIQDYKKGMQTNNNHKIDNHKTNNYKTNSYKINYTFSMFLSVIIFSIFILAQIILSLSYYATAVPFSEDVSSISSVISISKYYFNVNEIINISINYQEKNIGRVYLEIYSIDDPEYFYRYLDMDGDDILFVNGKSGRYSVKLYLSSDLSNKSDDILLSQKEFVIYADSSQSDCSIYAAGEPITIDLTRYIERFRQEGIFRPEKIYLLYYDEYDNFNGELRYGDILNNIIYFSALKLGTYQLFINDIYIDCYKINVLTDADNMSTNTYAFTEERREMYFPASNGLKSYIEGNILPEGIFSYAENGLQDTESSRMARYFEEKNREDIIGKIGLKSELLDNDSNVLSYMLINNKIESKPSVAVRDSEGKFKNSFVVLKNIRNGEYFEGDLLEINVNQTTSDNYDLDMYQADIYFANSTVRKIRLNDVDYSKGLDLDFEDLPVEDLMITRISRGDFVNVFAINPERVDFKDATVTFTAIGNVLWKCKEYNFSTRTCDGNFIKVLDMIPGGEYSFTLTPEDPVFAQSNYLTNPGFVSNITSGWTTLNEATCPNCGYAWIASDGVQSGVAEIYNTGNARTATLNYYQTFNLTIPLGTNLTNITFSALWRISNYDQPGNIYFWVQNAARTSTYCSWNQAFSSTTAWATTELRTNGSNGCYLSNFTKNTNYTVRLRCNIITSSTTRNERCHWDNINVTAFYIDVQAPTIVSFSSNPIIVNYDGTINFTANITDNIQVDMAWISINNTNYTMNYSGSGSIYYLDRFNTSIYPMRYNYTLYVNDTSSNIVFNSTKNFTVNDSLIPRVYLMGPIDGSFSNVSNNYFYYNVSDESNIANCSLRVDGTIQMTNYSVQKDIQQSLNTTLTQGIHYWNITCYDNSTNKNLNTSQTRNITVDTVLPVVALNSPGNNGRVSGYTSRILLFNYTPSDINLINCSLYGNFSGIFALNQTNSTPVSNSINSFSVYLADGLYLWNVRCCDMASNCAFNNTNFTLYIDSTPPYWSDNASYPASDMVWAIPKIYQFNITWNDVRSNISLVWIEHNFSGSLQNFTVQNISSQYYYNIDNLSAGYYIYKWYANDTLNNINYTDYYYYNVNKTPSAARLLLNGSDSDMDIGEGDSVNITASLVTPSSGYIQLYQDGVLINSGYSPLNNITYYYSQQRYNITVVYPATQNCSDSYSTHFITVTDTMPPTVALDNPEDNSWNPSTIILYYTPHDNIDIINCTLVFDGLINVTQSSVIAIQNNFTINVSDGTHNWTVGCTDSSGNYGQNNTVKYLRVDTVSPTSFNLSTPINNTIHSNNTPLLNWTDTTETNFANYTILVDNNPNFLLPDYIYHTFETANNTYAVHDANPWSDNVWFWSVMAYDIVGNNYASDYFLYILDTQPPTINILNPVNNYYNNNLTQNFYFTLSDFTELINCSFYIDRNLDNTNHSINKSLTQVFTKTFSTSGTYNWSIDCFDQAHNKQLTTLRYIHIDQIPPFAFSLLSPLNATLSNNNSPLLNWSPTIDTNFANYTIQLSDSVSFAYINLTYTNFELANTAYLSEPLSDTVWFWRVIAYDLAGNNHTVGDYSYEVDTLPPSAFDLSTPLNMTSSNNTSPLLNWTQTSDIHFRNYTIYVSDRPDYVNINFTYYTLNVTNTTYQTSNWQNNKIWYWKVSAFDNVSNNYTAGSYIYTTDNSTPIIRLISPANTSVWSASTTVPFVFNVTDISAITNCSLIINNEIMRTITDVELNVNQTVYEGLSNGQYNWSLNCTDTAGYIDTSPRWRLTVNVTLPTNIFYETSPSGTAQLSNPAIVNLSTSYDYVENYVQATINAVDYNIANASIIFNGSGFLLYPNTIINLSGVFQANTRNVGRVNWGVYIQNSSGTILICQTPGGTGGPLITTRNAKETEVGNCTSPNYNIRFNSGDRLLLRVNIYSASSVIYQHYIDNANPSYLRMAGYKLGVLNATLVNVTDQQPGEDYSFTEKCNVTCTDGYCIDTELYYELNNSFTQNYTVIGETGNVILNGSQYNPEVLATINSTLIANASLFANNYSFNNTFRCYAESQYSNSTSGIKNITVRDITSPAVVLASPGAISAADPGIIEFQYIPYDKRLSNCTIYTNVTGSWAPNQTNSTPLNNGFNYFYINFTNYGQYIWNILCCDITGNCAFNGTNRTLNIAGDLAINPGNVYFSNDRPSEGEIITVFAVITNQANRTERNVLVRFYEGDPDVDGIEIGSDTYINLTGLTNITVNVSWTAYKGTHEIYAKVDPLNVIIESDDDNNKGHNTAFTSVWQTYFGNVSVVMQRLGADNNSFINWSLQSGFDGNIYVADIDSSVSWINMKALTRDMYNNTNTNTLDDFENLDTCLGMESYIDNINSTYSLNGQPAMISNYNIYSTLVENVPDATSTNNTNFYSGILWDYSDSMDDYYSCQGVPALREDIIFITKINEDKEGASGIYDYEIRVPGELGNYKGTDNSVALYYEII